MRDKDSVVVEKNFRRVASLDNLRGYFTNRFLLGLVPMWLQNREVSKQLTTMQRQLERSEIKGLLTAAIVDARRGEYESARIATSDFYTRLRAEIDKGEGSFYTGDERQKLQSVFTERDATITLLAQRDQSSAERLTAMYSAYQSAIGQPLATTAATAAPPAVNQ